MPLAVVATVGTTSTTAVDPVPAIAEICSRLDGLPPVNRDVKNAIAVSCFDAIRILVVRVSPGPTITVAHGSEITVIVENEGGIRIYGDADGPVEREGMVGPGFYIRITPAVSWSWNMEGVPVGETWYESHRIIH